MPPRSSPPGARRRRFTIGPEGIAGARVVFDRDQTHHLARVLRLRAGDVVEATDGQGHDYVVRLESIGQVATGTLLDEHGATSESPLVLTLVVGIPRGDRMDTVIRAATELGVSRIVPLVTERTVVRPDPRRSGERVRRWRLVAAEASKQSGRGVVPGVTPPCLLPEALTVVVPGPRICLWEGPAPPLGQVIASAAGVAGAGVLVGPEGGLTAEEVRAIRDAGWSLCHVGPRILRTETAAIVAAALVQFLVGDLDGRWPKPDPLHG